MKKITYFETLRERTKTGKYQFAEFVGYLETFYDSTTDMKINIVFRKDDQLKWKATHLESGVLIVSGFTTKNACVEKVLTLVNRLGKLLKQDHLKGVMDELENYRNEVLNHAIERFNQGA